MDKICREFKRNRYFYGKLLTVRDFETEQNYFNNKRYMLNHLIHGSGIVCGLKVSQGQGDVQNIIISPGVALDGLGREIAVNNNRPLLLTGINGFSDECNDYYLCLKYTDDWQEKNPGNNTNADSAACCKASCTFCDEFCEYNNIVEHYEVSLMPVNDNDILPAFDDCGIYYNEVDIYNNGKTRITKTYPAYVYPETIFPVKLKAETGQMSEDSITVRETWSWGGAAEVNTINLTSNGFDGGTDTFIYHIKASGQVEKYQLISTIDGEPTDKKTDIVITTDVMGDAVRNKMTQATCDQCGANEIVRIARLSICSDGTLNIIPVEYVYSNQLLYDAIQLTAQRIDSITTVKDSSQATTGVITLTDIKDPALLKYSSEEIDPQLGNYPFTVTTGIITAQKEIEINNALDPAVSITILDNGRFVVTIEFNKKATPVSIVWWAVACTDTLDTASFSPVTNIDFKVSPLSLSVFKAEKFTPVITINNNDLSDSDRNDLKLRLFKKVVSYNTGSNVLEKGQRVAPGAIPAINKIVKPVENDGTTVVAASNTVVNNGIPSAVRVLAGTDTGSTLNAVTDVIKGQDFSNFSDITKGQNGISGRYLQPQPRRIEITGWNGQGNPAGKNVYIDEEPGKYEIDVSISKDGIASTTTIAVELLAIPILTIKEGTLSKRDLRTEALTTFKIYKVYLDNVDITTDSSQYTFKILQNGVESPQFKDSKTLDRVMITPAIYNDKENKWLLTVEHRNDRYGVLKKELILNLRLIKQL